MLSLLLFIRTYTCSGLANLLLQQKQHHPERYEEKLADETSSTLRELKEVRRPFFCFILLTLIFFSADDKMNLPSVTFVMAILKGIAISR